MSCVMIGLTGPTGAGKSFVSQIFSQFGFVVIDADKIAKDIMEKGSPVLLKIADAFGEDMLNADGSLNRQKLADTAFADEHKTKLLNSITHPAILDRAKALANQYAKQGSKYVMFDAPLLFESGADKMCDCIVVVVAPHDVRINRIQNRDGITKEQAQRRMSAQHDDDFYIQKSDFCIYANVSFDDLKYKVKSIIDEIKMQYENNL